MHARIISFITFALVFGFHNTAFANDMKEFSDIKNQIYIHDLESYNPQIFMHPRLINSIAGRWINLSYSQVTQEKIDEQCKTKVIVIEKNDDFSFSMNPSFADNKTQFILKQGSSYHVRRDYAGAIAYLDEMKKKEPASAEYLTSSTLASLNDERSIIMTSQNTFLEIHPRSGAVALYGRCS